MNINAGSPIRRLLLATFLLLAAGVSHAQVPADVGQWGPILDWGVQAKHMTMLPTGNVLVWSTGDDARVWHSDTATTFTPTPYPFNDLHCAAQATLPDGRVIVAGGQGYSTHVGTKENAIFDPFTMTWFKGADMFYARWYGTLLPLSDGRMLVTSGDDENRERVLLTEIYDPATDTWDVLENASYRDLLYPFMYQLPDGRVFDAGAREQTKFLDITGEGAWSDGPRNSFGSSGYAASSVMYLPGEILIAGGADPSIPNAAVIDMNTGTEQWRDIAPMNFARRRHDLTIMADGKILAVGGTGRGDNDAYAVLTPEIFDPDTETWTPMAPMVEARMYHSSTVLLADGRIVAGGGESDGRKHAEVYSPAYLFQGPRPTISSAPESAGYATSFVVTSPQSADIVSVALIRPAAVTHTFDHNQRYIPLPFTVSGTDLVVDAPPNGQVAPPGVYMLVIKNSAGVPSVASWIKIDQAAQLIPGAFWGRVRDAGTGDGIIGATVTIAGRPPYTTSLETGAYIFNDVPAGAYTIQVSAPGYADASAAATTTPGETTHVHFDLELAGSVSGRVTAQIGGQPIEGANIAFDSGSAVSDANGDYVIPSIAAGTQTLNVTAVTWLNQSADIDVPVGANVVQDFQLPPGHTSIEGEVLDARTDLPIEGANVSYSTRVLLTDPFGVFHFHMAEAGDHTVTATAQGYSNQSHDVQVVQGFETTVDFHLAPFGFANTTLTPTADARVKSTSPTKNYGLEPELRTRFDAAGTTYNSYVQFDLSQVQGDVDTATLRLYVTDGSVDGGTLYPITQTFQNNTITWDNAPPCGGTPITALGNVTAGDWVEVDVLSVLGAGTTFGVCLTNQSTNSALYSSMEGSNPPELVVEASSLTPGETGITGTVYAAETLAPIPNALVSHSGGSVIADASGVYSFTGIAAGMYDLTAAAPGFVPSQIVTQAVEGFITVQDFYLDPPLGEIVTLNPEHDARVKSTSATSNYGSDDFLRTRYDASGTIYETYLQFDVSGLTQPPDAATLRLFVTDGSPDGGDVFLLSETIDESTITWATAPGCVGTPVGSMGAVVPGDYAELDLTSLIVADGVYTLCFTSQTTNSAFYDSKEGANPPELVMDVGAGCVDDFSCDDGFYCNGAEVCDQGTCLAGAPVTCDDGVSCTADVCDELTDSCTNAPDDGLCGDGDFCNGVETCNPTLGCQSSAPPSCDDGVPCTADSCSTALGQCVNDPNDLLCDDGAFCNGAETCDPALGCFSAGSPCGTAVCDEGASLCLCSLDSECDDGVFCNGTESCDAGLCMPGPAPSCDDGIDCTIDQCDIFFDTCTSAADDSFCDDSLFCTGTEICTVGVGCVSSDPPSCGDGVACTVDECDLTLDSCVSFTDDARCDNGLFCDGAEMCDAVVGCLFDPAPCVGQSCDEAFDACVATGGAPSIGEIQTGGSTGSAVVATAAPVSAAPGDLYLAVISSKNHASVTGVSGLGLAWNFEVEQCGGRSQTGVSVFSAQGAPTAPEVVTATLGQGVETATISVLRYTGVSVVGAVAFENSNGPAGACSGGVDAASYAVTLDVTTPQSALLLVTALRSRSHTPDSGITEVSEIHTGSGGGTSGIAVSDAVSSVVGPTLMGGSFSKTNDWAAVAIELLPQAGEPFDAALPPVPVPAENPITEAKRALGKILFWEEQLSSNDTVACGTCHFPAAGGADPRPAVNPGPDRVFGNEDDAMGSLGIRRLDSSGTPIYHPDFGYLPQVTDRSAPNFFGGLFAPENFLDGAAGPVFLDPLTGDVSIADGGALENQALTPIVSPVEMGKEGRDWGEVTAKLDSVAPLDLATNLPPDIAAAIAANPTYAALFQAAFGDPAITPVRIAHAIATYERTLVPDQTPWDTFFAGDTTALTPDQQAGWDAFAVSLCATCHTPPMFTDNAFHNIGVRPPSDDTGRQQVTGLSEDRGKFKTPTLRNTGIKQEFMHNGVQTSLEEVMDFYIEARILQFLDNRDPLMPLTDIPPQDQPLVIDFIRNGLTDPRVANGDFPFDRPTLFSEGAPPVNEVPVADDDSATVAEGASVNIDLADGDVDFDDGLDLASISTVSGASNGSIAVNTDGTVDYTHDGSETTSDSFTYLIRDLAGQASNTATVTITVTAFNDPPTADDDNASVEEGASVNIDLADGDTDSDDGLDLASISIVGAASNGSVVVNPDGSVDYTHDGSETTSDSFTYQIRDLAGQLSNTATVTITVTPFNDPPTADDDGATVDEGGSVTIDLADGDADSDDGLDLTSISIVGAASNGSVVVNADGSVDYTHDGSETTSDSFTYQIRDLAGQPSNTATVTIAVTNSNDAPTADDDSASVDEGGSVNVDLADGDADSDDGLDLTSISIVGAASNGSVVVNPDGSVDYTHDGGESTSDSFTYLIRDLAGQASNTATVTITVTPVNDAPTADDDSASVDEGGSVNVNLADGDADADDGLDLASISIVSGASNGSIGVNADGTVDYSHDGSETTSDSFTYQIRDLAGLPSNTATVTISVTPVNDAPTADDDSASVDEGGSVNVNLADGDADADDGLDLTSISIVGAASNGSVAVNADGSVDYTHDGGETTGDSFTYQIRDLAGLPSNTATVSITVTPVNDAPTADDDSTTVDEGGSVNIDLADGDADSDDGLDLASISILGAASNGSVVVNADGSVDYTHDGSETTSDSFTYQIRDLAGQPSNTATVTIAVTGSNDAPTADDDSASVDEGGSVNIDLADGDADADDGLDLTSISIVGAASNGSVVVNPDGSVDYTHDGSETTSDSFTYQIRDLAGQPSNTATVTISVTPVNDAPTADDDSASVDEGGSVNVNLADGDTDADDGLDLASISIVGAAANGSVVVNADGSVDYTHDGGETTGDSFTYQIRDLAGQPSNTATVTISVTAVNDAPTADDDGATVDEGGSVNVNLADGDADVDDGLDLTSINIVDAASNGSVVVNADGSVDYTHDGSETTSDSFTYQIRDLAGLPSNTATVTISVTPVNDAPTADDDIASVDEGGSVNVNLADGDADSDDGLDLASISIVGAASNGSVVVNPDGSVDYTHDGGETTSDSFTYLIRDLAGQASNTATVTISVTGSNDAPTADDDSASVDEGGSVNVNLADGDADADDGLDLASISIVSGASNGSIGVNADGTVDYTHDGSETTSDSFTYQIHDLAGLPSNTATVTISVTPVNDAPTADDDSATVDEGGSVNIDLADGDADADDGLDLASISIVGAAANGSVVVNADGSVDYTHDGGETIGDSFTYQIRDLAGQPSNTATVSIAVTPVNDAPTADDDSTTVDEGGSVNIDLADGDADADDGLDLASISIVGAASNGSVVVNPDGSVDYTHDGSETTSDSFTYLIRDLAGQPSNTATVTIAVTGSNDAPTADDDSASVDEGGSVNIDLADGDADADDGLDLTSISIVGAASNGSVVVNPDGSVDYTHDGSETTSDSFTYQIRDLAGQPSNTATVTISVTPVNDAPTADDDSASVDEGGSVNVNLADGDADADDGLDLTSINIVDAASSGSVVVNADGSVDYTHDGSETTGDSFTYQIRDLAGQPSNTATVSITVTAVNDAPTADDDSASVDEGGSVNIDLADGDADADDGLDLTSISIVGAAANGSVVVNADGSVDYTHDGGETTGDSFTYQIRDLAGQPSNTATVSITVTPVNDAPTADDDSASVDEGGSVNIDLADGDADADDGLDLTSISIVGAAANGSVVVNADGSVDYTHDGGETTGDSFTYQIRDLAGQLSNTATVSIAVTGFNDAPTADDDSANVDEGGSVNIDLADGDADSDDGLDLTSISIVSAAANGSVVVNADGSVDYTHDGSETTGDSFTYQIRDLAGQPSNTATVSIAVTPVNDAPTADDDSTTVDEGGSVNIDLADGDADADDGLDLASISIVGAAANGSVVVNADGSVDYTHDGGETTGDSFTYQIRDLAGQPSNTATVSIAVTPVNDAPTADDDSTTVDEGGSVNIDLADGDADSDDGLDLASISIVGAASNGSVVVNADGSVDYTHDGSETTSDSFTYQIRDLAGQPSNTATVTIAVTGSNDAPTADDDSASVDEGGSVNIDLADGDADSDDGLDLTSISIVGAASNGSVVVNPDGSVDYTHDGGETTSDSFTYLIRDLAGLPSNTATVTIAVTAVNDAPTADDDSASVDEGGSVNIDLADGDTDADDGLDLTSINIVGAASNGSVVVNPDGSVDYTHDGSETTSDSFTYLISDLAGLPSNTATVTITVTPVNDAPTADDDSASVDEGGSVNIDLAAGDADADDGLDLTSINIVGAASNGSVVVNPDGSVDYTHDGSETTSDSFTYLISDLAGLPSNTATVSITVTGVNDAPTADDDSASVDEGGSVNIDLAAGDADADDGLDLTSISIVGAASNGSVVVNPDGSVDYTHDGSETTSDSFSYQISDLAGLPSNTATVSITVTGVNDAPTADDDSASVDEGASVNIDLAAGDADADDGLDLTSISIVGAASNGSVVVNPDGSVDYTHDGSETTSDSFSYQISDLAGQPSNTATVSITVTGVNDAPTADDDSATVDEGGSVNIDLADGDADADDGLDLTSISIVGAASNGSVVVNPDGSVDYTHDGSETTSDSFSYQISDLAGLPSNTATVSITVTGVNDAPTADDDSATVDEGGSVNIDLADGDADADDGLDLASISIVGAASNGSVVVNPDGSVDYTHDGSETTSDSFSYQISDLAGLPSNTATVSITVTGVNDAPTADDDSATVDEGAVVNIDLADGDADADDGLDLTSISIVGAASNGSVVVNPDGSVDYTHDGSETTSDSFSYQISDLAGLPSNTATVSITVTPVNDAPTADDDSASVDEGGSVNVNLADGDADADDGLDLASISIVGAASNGSVVVNPDGSVDYTHDGSETTSDSFTYQIRDLAGQPSNTATVSITVTPVNDAPTADDDSATVDEGGSVSIDLADGDADADDGLDLTSISIVGAASNGSVVVNPDGSVDYTHDGSETTSDSFTYQISDLSGLPSNTATVSITVTGVNDAPTADDDSATVDEGGSVNIDLADGDADADDGLDLTSISIVGAASNGSVVVNPDGSVDYTHDGGETTSDSFSYQISDLAGLPSNTATVSITVTGVNDAPTADDDSATVGEGGSVNIDLADGDADADDGLDLASISIVGAASNGSVVVNPDGSVDYTHDGGETTSDSFSYLIRDLAGLPSNTATVSITVTPLNDAPTADDDSASVDEGGSVNIDLADGDADADDGLDLASISIVSAAANGSVVVNPDGSVDYTHDGSETTSDSFSYQISDLAGLPSNTATVSITVTPVNDAPTADDDSASVDEGGSVNVNLADGDADADDGLDLTSISIVGAASNGSVVVNPDGSVDYTHDGSETTSDSFSYQISDLAGLPSNTATVSITVTGVNDAPTADDDSATVDEGASVNIDLADGDADSDDGLDLASISIVGPASNGSVVVNPNGTVAYTHDGSETTSDSFTYQISDLSGQPSNTATVTITVTPVNDPPTADDDSAGVDEGASVNIDLADGDTDPDDGLDLTSISVISVPSNGSLVINTDGTVDYTHDGGETTSDSFSYQIQDVGGETSNTATVIITVTPVNDPPVADFDTAFVGEGGTVIINLADGDTDPDDGLDLASIEIDSGPSNASAVVNPDGTVTYTHDGSETTSDSFIYTIKDLSGQPSNYAAVIIIVTPSNDAPTADDDSTSVGEGSSVNIDLAFNDSDPDDGLDLTSISVVSAPTNGGLVVNADGTADYTHDGSETTSDSFTYQIRDAAGQLSNTANVSISVTP